MAGGQHQGVALQLIGAGLGHHRGAGELPALGMEPVQLMLEAHLTAQGGDLLPHGAHHMAKNVGADVGLVGVGDVLRRAMFDKGIKDMADAGVADAGGQLAVGEGPGAALAKLDVGGAGELPRPPEVLHIGGALVHVPAPFQHHGPQPGPGQGQGGE